MKKIEKFTGKYRFLSNFFICFPNFIVYNNRKFRSVEHAFQAAKCANDNDMDLFMIVDKPEDAKSLGNSVKLREDWEKVKVSIMKECVRQKFSYPKLKSMLLETGDAVLVEGNHWGDTFWGVCKGEGQNNLGKILMEIRDEFRKEKS